MGVHGTSGSPKCFPRTPKSHPKMSKWRSQASQNHMFPMFSNACHTKHQMHVDRGPAAEGVALKIRRTPRRGAAGRDGIATKFPSKLGFRGHTLCRRPLRAASVGELEKHRKIGQQKKRSRAPKWSPSCTPAGTQNRQKREKTALRSSLKPIPEIAEKSVAFWAP